MQERSRFYDTISMLGHDTSQLGANMGVGAWEVLISRMMRRDAVVDTGCKTNHLFQLEGRPPVPNLGHQDLGFSKVQVKMTTASSLQNRCRGIVKASIWIAVCKFCQ
jgi:hypothetical protein